MSLYIVHPAWHASNLNASMRNIFSPLLLTSLLGGVAGRPKWEMPDYDDPA